MKKIILMLVIDLLLFSPGEVTNMETGNSAPCFQQKVAIVEPEKKDQQILVSEELKNTVEEPIKNNIAQPKEVKEREETTNVSREDGRKKADIFEATAYCSCVKCCGKSDGITKSGVKVHNGTLAVDPRIIPLGSKVYIEGMGWFIAEDTGNFSGKRVDIYMETHDKALQFGRRNVKVIL